MKVRIDGVLVETDVNGCVDTWTLHCDSCPVLVYHQDGHCVIAAVDADGRSQCTEGVAYDVHSFSDKHEQHEAVVPAGDTASDSPTRRVRSAPPTRYVQYLTMYLRTAGNLGFRRGAQLWKSFSIKERSTAAPEVLCAKAMTLS